MGYVVARKTECRTTKMLIIRNKTVHGDSLFGRADKMRIFLANNEYGSVCESFCHIYLDYLDRSYLYTNTAHPDQFARGIYRYSISTFITCSYTASRNFGGNTVKPVLSGHLK